MKVRACFENEHWCHIGVRSKIIEFSSGSNLFGLFWEMIDGRVSKVDSTN